MRYISSGMHLSNIVDEDVEDLRRIKVPDEHMCELDLFLKPFHLTARLYICRFYIRARLGKKDHETILKLLKETYEENWQHDTPGRIGDPDDVTHKNPIQNAVIFFWLYKTLGLRKPKFLF